MSGGGKLCIVTADDLGISPEVNRGIVEGYRHGIVTAASLLVNAPATADAVALVRRFRGLEIGLHLSIVEGISLRGVAGTLTDELRYFDGRLCLHRGWRQFLRRYLLARIDFQELEEELTLQVERFLESFPGIPFANCTQHLHLLPGVRDVVLRLAARYRIGALRAAPFAGAGLRLGARAPALLAVNALAPSLQRAARRGGLKTTDRCCGFETTGRTREADLLRFAAAAAAGSTEWMAHPGHDCPALRGGLPWAYRGFAWSAELVALCSRSVRSACRTHRLELIRFSDL